MITGIEHVGIMSRDTKTLAGWYEKVLDFSTAFVSDDQAACPIIFLKHREGSVLELFPWKEGFEAAEDSTTRQTMHISIYTDDFDAALEQLKSHDTEIVGEPFEILGGARIVFFRDCEGNYLHLVQRNTIPWE